MARIEVRQTAATTSGGLVWSMRAGTGKTCYIRQVKGQVSFDGTSVAASTLRYGFYRFTTANPSGGTALNIVKKRTSYATSNVQDIRQLDTGLTTTGIVFDTDPWHVISLSLTALIGTAPTGQNIAAPSMPFTLYEDIGGNERYDAFELAPNEGLGIRLQTVNAIIGLGIYGSIEWDER